MDARVASFENINENLPLNGVDVSEMYYIYKIMRTTMFRIYSYITPM